MLQIRRSKERGTANFGWLDSRHTFSFGEYHDPKHMGFGPLRVINEDRVSPGQGFGTHGHRDMEIISYVLEGGLEHKDSIGTGSVIRPGDVQVMSAGTGIRHSEFNHSKTEPVHFLQIWVIPDRVGITPRYEQKAFPEADKRSRLRLVGSSDGHDGSVVIHQDVEMLRSGPEQRGTGNPRAGDRAQGVAAGGSRQCRGERPAAGQWRRCGADRRAGADRLGQDGWRGIPRIRPSVGRSPICAWARAPRRRPKMVIGRRPSPKSALVPSIRHD